MTAAQTKLVKLAPTISVLALAGICVWCNQDSDAAAEKGESLPTVTAAQLKPVVVPPSRRDPFVIRADPGPAHVKTPPPKKDTKGSAASAAELATTVHGLTLNATCVSDGTGMAIINGRVYNVDDTLEGAGASHKFIVAEVFEDHVRLECGDQSFELGFPEGSPAPEHALTSPDKHKPEKLPPAVQGTKIK